MIEEVLTNIASIVPTAGGEPSLVDGSVPVAYVCSAIGALILTRFTGAAGHITVAVNFAALLVGTLLADWLLGGIRLPIDHTLHQPLLVSVIGMIAGAFAVLWFSNGENANA